MIKEVIELLKLDDYHGKSEVIEQAKGGYKLAEGWKETRKLFKRRLKWRLRRL